LETVGKLQIFIPVSQHPVSDYDFHRIHKDKYLSDNESNAPSRGRGRQGGRGTPDKKQRSKSRTRSLFHRKKSAVAEA
jgi:hypothetical protein